MGKMHTRKHISRQRETAVGVFAFSKIKYLLIGRITVIMIDVTKIDGREITVNSDLIETLEEIPETVITLTTGKKIIVKESRQKVKNLVKSYKQEIFQKYILNEEID